MNCWIPNGAWKVFNKDTQPFYRLIMLGHICPPSKVLWKEQAGSMSGSSGKRYCESKQMQIGNCFQEETHCCAIQKCLC